MKTPSPFEKYFGIGCHNFQFDNFLARLADSHEQIVAIMLEYDRSEPEIFKALEHSGEPQGLGQIRFRGIVNRLRLHLARGGYLLQ